MSNLGRGIENITLLFRHFFDVWIDIIYKVLMHNIIVTTTQVRGSTFKRKVRGALKEDFPEEMEP